MQSSASPTVYEPVQAGGGTAVTVEGTVVLVELRAYAVGDVKPYAVALQLDANDTKLLARLSSYPSGLPNCKVRTPSQQSEQL